MRLGAPLAVLLLVAPFGLNAQQPTRAVPADSASPRPVSVQPRVPGPDFEEVLSLRQVGPPAMSPDGRSVAFTVTTADWQENRFDTEIWIARDAAPPFQLTRTEKGSSTSPRWSPDGGWLAFLTDRGSKTQVWLIRPDGGEAQPLTRTTEGVADYRWAPDSRRIAFTMRDPEPDSAKQRRDRLGEFAVDDRDYRLTHLWLVDVAPDPWPAPPERPCEPGRGSRDSGQAAAAARDLCVRPPEPVRLTSGAFTVTGFEWSPDGTRIAIEHRRDPLFFASYHTTDISVLTVATRELHPLVTGPGFDGGPRWSPDSRWIVYSTSAGDTTSNFYRNVKLAKIAAEGGTPVRLAADLDENPDVVSWNPTGLYLLAFRGTRRALFTVDPVSGRTSPFANAPDAIWTVSFSADGRSLALYGETPTTLAEIYRTATTPFRPVAVTEMSRQIEGWPVGTSEVIAWNSTDGERIEGVLHKPAGFDPHHRYPLLVVIHGGPTGIDTPTPVVVGYVYPITQWLARGALILRPNYRGSTGYGERFRSLNVRNLGVGDAWDVLSGVDHLVRLGIVDTTRMGAMGWSQGGYISAFLTTTTTRFRAISVGAGISDWMTYYVNSDAHPFTRQWLRATPWDDADIYARTSPITYVRGARTPTLFQHGENDRRVPIANAYELFQALQDLGVETQLIVYRGFGHAITRPRERLAATWHNWNWFGRHLWGDAPDSSATGVPQAAPRP